MLAFPAGNYPTQHQSQSYFVRWKESGESPYVLNDTRFRIKFGVLKVTNRPRTVKRGRLKAGNATNLQADIMIMPVEKLGSPAPKETQVWSNPEALHWYRDGWDSTFRPNEFGDEATQSAMRRLKMVLDGHLVLLQYFRNETISMLPTNRSAYLWLFFTLDFLSGFFYTIGGRQLRTLGKYKLKVGISCSELTLKEYLYELDIKGWNDFTIKPLKH